MCMRVCVCVILLILFSSLSLLFFILCREKGDGMRWSDAGRADKHGTLASSFFNLSFFFFLAVMSLRKREMEMGGG